MPCSDTPEACASRAAATAEVVAGRYGLEPVTRWHAVAHFEPQVAVRTTRFTTRASGRHTFRSLALERALWSRTLQSV